MKSIDFSSENIERLATITDTLGDTLIKTGFGNYVDLLSQIRLVAERRDKEKFEELVINRGLFGGAGALWEIWIEDMQLSMKFEKEFCDFVDHLKRMGIESERINQVREGFNRN